MAGWVVLWLVLSVGFVWWVWWSADKRLSGGVMRRLARRPEYSIRVSWADDVWNPGRRAGVNNRLFGKGWATYTRDAEGLVHLQFVGDDGHEQSFSGPAPHPATTRHLGTWLGVALLVVPTGLGFALGYVLATGPAPTRLVVGGLAALAGWLVFRGAILAWLATHRTSVRRGR
jgi:hypothetical protein